MHKITDISPMVEYFETETSPSELAERVVGIQNRYARAVLADDDLCGKQCTTADDLHFLQELYTRLVQVCNKNGITR